jgi:DNA-directed RNA polymerase subunit RPC12/RpoP
MTSHEEQEPPPDECPSCGSRKVVRIVYGMPGPDLVEAYERGEVELGGCVIGENDPEWHCKKCGHDWGDG